MSLDVYLSLRDANVSRLTSGIYVRENGQTKEISEEEWSRRHPGREPVRYVPDDSGSDIVYQANITHNLNTMAREAGLYEALWRPEELHIKVASELIEPLEKGLAKLKASPGLYGLYNPANGWGTYDLLVQFTEAYLNACKKYPTAEVRVSR